MIFFTSERISEKRSFTPEGFLLIEDAALARTGKQLYGPGETPVSVGPNGYAEIERLPEEVFRPETMASVNGKAFVDNHPDEDVTPDNWRMLTHGVVMNPRRGKGVDDELMLGDIIVYDKDLIAAIQAGKREVSCGYDCDYEELSPGIGRQRNIIINHVALVDNGRCGPRCAIGDHAHNPQEKPMAKSWTERLSDAFKSKDEAAFSAALAEGDKGDMADAVHVHIHGNARDDATAGKGVETTAQNDAADEAIPAWFKAHVESNNARFDKIEKMMKGKDGMTEDKPLVEAADGVAVVLGKSADDMDPDMMSDAIAVQLKDEAPAGCDAAMVSKAKDSAFLGESFEETLADAEILSPGIDAPAFDKAASPKKTFDSIDGLRRSALDGFYQTPEGREIIDVVMAGRTFDAKAMDCACARATFRAVAGIKKAKNMAGTGLDTSRPSSGGGLGVVGAVTTLAEMNKRHAEYYAR